MKFKVLQFLLFFAVIVHSITAQDIDTIKNVLESDTTDLTISDTTVVEVEDSTAKRPPVDKRKIRRATLASAIVPGLGQAFNKQIYKTPIYPGAMVFSISTGLGYRSIFNQYKDSLNLTVGLDSIASSKRNQLRLKQNNTRVISNSAFAAAGFMYAANIIDAYVSAQIKERAKNDGYSTMLSAYRSAALPGLGQITNKQYWKVPVFWLLLSGTGVSAVYWHNKKQCHGQLYLNRIRYNFEDVELFDNCVYNSNRTFTNADLLAFRDRYKRNFELSLVAMGLAYILNIADALVYSHLNNFDMDDALSISIQPIYRPSGFGNNYFGFNLKVQI